MQRSGRGHRHSQEASKHRAASMAVPSHFRISSVNVDTVSMIIKAKKSNVAIAQVNGPWSDGIDCDFLKGQQSRLSRSQVSIASTRKLHLATRLTRGTQCCNTIIQKRASQVMCGRVVKLRLTNMPDNLMVPSQHVVDQNCRDANLTVMRIVRRICAH
jgi:hypothetical protein